MKKQYLEYVIEKLSDFLPIRSRAMFGGYGIYSGEFIIGLIDDSRLYLKVDDSNRPMFEQYDMGPFDPYGDGIHLMRSYYELPEEILEDKKRLGDFVFSSLDASQRAFKNKKSKPSQKRTKKSKDEGSLN